MYLKELECFVSIRKKDPWTDTDKVKSMTFSYDFEAINNARYKIAPNKIGLFKTSSKFNFFSFVKYIF